MANFPLEKPVCISRIFEAHTALLIGGCFNSKLVDAIFSLWDKEGKVAQIICDGCSGRFDAKRNHRHSFAAAIIGWVGGALIGFSIGIAVGFAGIPSTLPLAIVGAVVFWLVAGKRQQCSNCNKINWL